jgi:hypothetical protein
MAAVRNDILKGFPPLPPNAFASVPKICSKILPPPPPALPPPEPPLPPPPLPPPPPPMPLTNNASDDVSSSPSAMLSKIKQCMTTAMTFIF